MTSKEKRTILHVDMNSCYASIEQARNPSLKGKAMAVVGDVKNRNGIILAKSPEAKKAGVKTGEVIWEAKEKCPKLITVPANFSVYLYYSRLAQYLYLDYSNQVEAFGIDECWLDITGSTGLFGPADQVAQTIRQRMKEELGITVSIGIANNKTMAKLGSDLKKPDAQTRIQEDNYKEVAWPRPVSDLLFCGPKTTKKLRKFGIDRIGDLAQADPNLIQKTLGVNGLRLREAANNREDTPVAPYNYQAPVKSVGCGTTFPRDLVSKEDVQLALLRLSQEVEKSLIEEGLAGSAIALTIRDKDLANWTGWVPLAYPCQNALELSDGAWTVFQKLWTWKKDIRAMTVRAFKLVPKDQPRQTNVFTDYRRHEKKERLSSAVYDLQARYGAKSVIPACLASFDLARSLDGDRVVLPKNQFAALREVAD